MMAIRRLRAPALAAVTALTLRDPQLPLATQPRPRRARYDDLERKLSEAPVITVPTITIGRSPVTSTARPPGGHPCAEVLGRYSHQILNGIGHNVPQEAPQAFAKSGHGRSTGIRGREPARPSRKSSKRVTRPLIDSMSAGADCASG